MLTATDLAREVVATRRAEAHQDALRTAVRLARRQERLTRRMQRVEGALSGS